MDNPVTLLFVIIFGIPALILSVWFFIWRVIPGVWQYAQEKNDDPDNLWP